MLFGIGTYMLIAFSDSVYVEEIPDLSYRKFVFLGEGGRTYFRWKNGDEREEDVIHMLEERRREMRRRGAEELMCRMCWEEDSVHIFCRQCGGKVCRSCFMRVLSSRSLVFACPYCSFETGVEEVNPLDRERKETLFRRRMGMI